MSHVETPLARKLDTFVRLSPVELACLAELQSRRRTVAALTEIVHEGQTDHRAWILQEGWANCYKLVPSGGRQIIGFPLPGDFMGLRSVLLRTSDHSFASLTDAVVSEVSRQRIIEIFQEFPRLATAILWATSRDEAMVVEHLVNIGRRSAIERLAHLFLELGQRLEMVGSGVIHRICLPAQSVRPGRCPRPHRHSRQSCASAAARAGADYGQGPSGDHSRPGRSQGVGGVRQRLPQRGPRSKITLGGSPRCLGSPLCAGNTERLIQVETLHAERHTDVRPSRHAIACKTPIRQ